MAKREAVFLELPLKRRARRSGAEGCDLAFLVERQQAVHALQREAQNGRVAGGNVDVAGHRRAAAINDDREALAIGPSQDLAALRRCWLGAPRRRGSGRKLRSAWPANRENFARGHGGCAFPHRSIPADAAADATAALARLPMPGWHRAISRPARSTAGSETPARRVSAESRFARRPSRSSGAGRFLVPDPLFAVPENRRDNGRFSHAAAWLSSSGRISRPAPVWDRCRCEPRLVSWDKLREAIHGQAANFTVGARGG